VKRNTQNVQNLFVAQRYELHVTDIREVKKLIAYISTALSIFINPDIFDPEVHAE
jgi:uncharacterized ubiquitin-like protein YukD